MEALFLSVDCGGTSLRMALMNDRGEVLEMKRWSSDSIRKAEDLAQTLAHEAQSFANQHPSAIRGLALGIPGLVDAQTGVVLQSPHFPLWREVPLRRLLSARLPFPVLMDNDANQAALGEAWLGAGKEWADFIFISLGTGIGGGIILDRKIFHGPNGFAGEVGHIVIERQGLPGALGSRGTLESFASQSGLKLQLADLKRNPGTLSQALLALDENSEDLPRQLQQLALGKDPQAQAIWDGFGRALACGIASLAHGFGVLHFVIGGGLSGSWELFQPSMQDDLRTRLYSSLVEKIHVVPARLANQAGLIGGVRRILDTLDSSVKS